MAQTFYFYDLETSGVSARQARIMQFAGQRTDMRLRPIGEPHNFLIKLSDDEVPEPDAILITGITPQMTLRDGMTEAEFLKVFHDQIATPDTIFTGFNTIRFDDEFMRFLHYRNFYDPYEWGWTDNKSRWDMLDVARMTRALRPEGIEWPFDGKGNPSNRLGLLTAVNKLDHAHAHDALNDVLATIAVAKLIQDKQPKLFDYLLSMRSKKDIQKLVQSGEPFVYTSGKYPSEFEKTTVVATLAEHPTRSGAALVYDLRHDPTKFIDLSAEELAESWRWKKDRTELQLPVKTLQYNRCPAIAPLGTLDEASEKRLHLKREDLQANVEALRQASGFVDKLFKAIEIMDVAQQARLLEDQSDVDTKLYDGFVNDRGDKDQMGVVRSAGAEELRTLTPEFKDQRLQALLPLYKARNFPSTLNEEERLAWQQFREHKLYGGKEKSLLAKFFKRLDELGAQTNLSGEQKYLLEELALYGQSLMPDL